MAVTEAGGLSVRRGPAAEQKTSAPHAILFLFMASLMLPIVLNIGPFALSPSRLFCLLAFFPCLFMWLTGKAGPVRTFDFMFLFAASWAALTMLVNHGIAGGYERAGFIIVEWVGGYLFGRTMIRSANDFRAYLKMAMAALVVMLPFGILESQSGRPIIIEALSRFIETEPVIDHDVRLGLERAQVIFPHPILYGIFCAAMLGIVSRGLSFGSSAFTSVVRIGVIAINTICSVSSGAWLLFLIQSAFLIYDWIMRNVVQRWQLLLFGFITMYLLLMLVAESSPVKVFVRYLTLNPASGHYRIAQFDAAILNVFDNPIFGLGGRDWVRPRWMIPSIDNYWMVLAVRHGAVLFVVFLGGILLNMYRIGRKRMADPADRALQVGYLISLGSFLIAVITVHVWSNMNVWFMFFLGAGVWMIGARERGEEPEAPDPEDPSAAPAAASRYSRFAPKPKATTGQRQVARRKR